MAADVPSVHDPQMADTVQALEEVLAEADALIRQQLKERGLDVPHLVVAVAPDGQSVPAATSVRMACGPSAKT